MLNKILIILLLFNLSSCNNITKEDDDESIDIEKAENVKLSSFISNISYIELVTPEDILSSECMIKMTDSYIYCLDYLQNKLFVFNWQGQLISKLDKIGRGPGEYQSIALFFISKDDDILEIYDQSSKKIIYYQNISFELIEEKEVKSLVHFDSGVKISNNHFVVSTNGYLNVFNKKKTNADFISIENGMATKLYFDRNYPNEDEMHYLHFRLFPEKLLKNEDGDIFASVLYKNNFFKYTDGEFSPFLSINFVGGEQIDNNYLAGLPRKEQFEYFYRSENFVNLASYPHLAYNDKDITIVNYLYNTSQKFNYTNSFRHFIEFKNSNKTIHAKSIVNDLTEFPKIITISNFSPKTGGSPYIKPKFKNQLITVVSPSVELEKDSSIIVNDDLTVKSSDNLVIVLMELK